MNCNVSWVPKPMQGFETENCVKEYKSGKTDEKNRLIEKNLRLALFVANKFPGEDTEELFSVGIIGLIKAVNSFKTEKNTRFTTYATKCIENEILMFLRKNKNQKSNVSMEESINIDKEGNCLNITDILSSDENVGDTIEKKEIKKNIMKYISKLKDDEKEIIVMRYGLDGTREKTQKEISEIMGCSQSSVSKKEKQILKDMKKFLLNEKLYM